MLKRIITALVCLGASGLYVTADLAAQSNDTAVRPEVVRQAVSKSLPLLESIRLPFLEQTGCVSCHHNSLPALAAGLARARGFAANEQIARDESAQILAIWRQGREKLLQGDSFAGQDFTAAFTLTGLAANEQAPNATTDAMVYYLLGRQTTDGHWQALGSGRPPLDSTEITTTALAIRALQVYAPPSLRREAETRLGRARAWLSQAKPNNLNEQNFQLLGLAWAKAEKSVLQKLAQAVLAQQRPDGGWSQLPTLASDAFATGQALTTLAQAGGVPVTQQAYQRGVKFLLDTQRADGSWLVESRAYPFQKYFESGFPHGKHQWISAAATSWATMALTLAVVTPAQLSRNN